MSILIAPSVFSNVYLFWWVSNTWCLYNTKVWLLKVLTQKQSFVRHSRCCHHVWVMNSKTMSQTLETKYIIHLIRTRFQQKMDEHTSMVFKCWYLCCVIVKSYMRGMDLCDNLQSLVFCGVFCRSLYVFVWSLHCMPCYLQLRLPVWYLQIFFT